MNQQEIDNSAAASLIDRAFSQEYSYTSSVLMLQAAARLDEYVNASELEKVLTNQWLDSEYIKRSIK